ncbi:outer membrane protein assembly factor BamA [Chromatiales bacterium (ex Bugula neritina AB1)]|nr:outer membrane protein assembly factor BamA [Chromatiales bacterium (ex Bugula neritina AB1)]
MPSGSIARFSGFKSPLSLCLLLVLLSPLSLAAAGQAFIIKDIVIRGIEHVEKGTVLSYLPVRADDRFETDRDSGRVIRALYETELFDDVSLSRDEGTLIVTVDERPAIVAVKVKGSKALSKEQMDETLRAIGLAPGRIFRRSVLDNLETEVRQVYFSRGQYGTTVTSSVDSLERNRVNVNVEVTEGAIAKISHVNIVGNKAFDEDRLLDLLESGVGGWNPFGSRDEYSRAKLTADTEKLRAWYLDRGYLRFDITSTQVTISPDKRDINVTINVDEGEQYTVGAISFSGEDLSVTEEQLAALLVMSEGDVYSRKLMTKSSNAIVDRLAEDGYAFADVKVIPDVNDESRTVGLNLDIDPGKRVYVRRISFSGQSRTQDEVLRREMRQMEGGRFSPLALSRSQTRLQRLPYIDRINITTPRVPGSDELVDIVVGVTEGPSGSFGAGAGYGSDGFIFNINFTQENLFGTGERIALTFDNSTSQDNFSISYTDPYYTPDGISRNVRAFIKKTDTSELSSTAKFVLDSYGVKLRYGVPLSEFSTFSFGVGFENVQAIQTNESSPEIIEFIDEFGKEYDLFDLSFGYIHDTRDRTIFATRGTRNSLSLEVTTPNSDLSYLKLGYNFEYFRPLTERYTLSFSARVNYGEGEKGLDSLPFFRRFFAGGIQSVRGYRRSTLGPRDNNGEGDAQGGDFRTIGSLEVIFPPPFVETAGATRMSVFTDLGNVFSDVSDFETDELRGSYGLAFVWLAPIGPLTFSIAETFNDRNSDSKQSFQFTIGSLF